MCAAGRARRRARRAPSRPTLPSPRSRPWSATSCARAARRSSLLVRLLGMVGEGAAGGLATIGVVARELALDRGELVGRRVPVDDVPHLRRDVAAGGDALV